MQGINKVCHYYYYYYYCLQYDSVDYMSKKQKQRASYGGVRVRGSTSERLASGEIG